MASSATEHTPLRRSSSGCGDMAFRARLLTIVASIAEGYDIGVMANALGPIQKEFGLSPLMVGIVVSSLVWAAMVVSPLAGSLADSKFIGRKLGIAIAAAVISAGNLCWALAPNVIILLTGRIIMGLGIGIGVPVITVYMAEVAPVSLRGLYVSMEVLFLESGILLGFVAGALIVGVPNDWRIMVGIGAVLPLICSIFALTPYLPESPRFLQAIGRVEEAREILLDLLHGDEQEVHNAFARWAEEARSNKQGMDWSSVISAFSGSHFPVALAGIGLGLFFTLSGIACFTNYSVDILIKSGMSRKSAAVTMLLVSLLKTCTLIVPTFFLMDRWGRRPLLLISAAILSCASGFVALGRYADLGGIWIAIGLGIFAFGFSAGLGPVFFVYISEVFDNSTRAKGVSCSFFLARLIGALWVLIYPVLTASIGISMVFCIFAGCNACALVFIWFFCPETLGVSLEDMNGIFQDQKVTPRATLL